MRRALWFFATVVLSMCVMVGAQADPIGYAATLDPTPGVESYRLLRIDLATGISTTVGRINYFDVEGLAISPEGILYGVSDASKTLFTIDTSFGRGSAVGAGSNNLGVSGEGVGSFDSLDLGLAFGCDGRLWMSSDTTGKLWEVDRNSGRARLVGNLGVKISGLAGAADGLYGIGIEADRGLYKINTEDATAVRIGPTTPIAPYVDAGLDVDSDGNFWGVLDYDPPPDNRPNDSGKQSDLVRIDPRSGAYTYISRTFPEVEGLAIGRPPACRVVAGGAPPAIPVNQFGALAMLTAVMLLFGLASVRMLR